MERVIIKESSIEWDKMWNWLEQHPLNAELNDPSIANNTINNEKWMYMGSFRNKDGCTVSEFRHRSFPLDGEIKYLKMNHDIILNDSDIEHKKQIK